MPWLRHHCALMTASEEIQESAYPPRIKRERRRELEQQRAQLVAQSGDLLEKSLERLSRAREQPLMGDHLGHLDRKPEG